VSTDPTGAPEQQAPGAEEEELRKAYEAELSRITTTDMMAQAAVSLLNLGARRLQAERDLEQVRDAIDGVRALLGILERRIAEELGPMRDALSQLQMAYAREVQAGPGSGQPGAGGDESDGSARGSGSGGNDGDGSPPGGESTEQGGPPAPGQTPPSGRHPGPAESSGRLWVPGG
jgi:hypothetical protein